VSYFVSQIFALPLLCVSRAETSNKFAADTLSRQTTNIPEFEIKHNLVVPSRLAFLTHSLTTWFSARENVTGWSHESDQMPERSKVLAGLKQGAKCGLIFLLFETVAAFGQGFFIGQITASSGGIINAISERSDTVKTGIASIVGQNHVWNAINRDLQRHTKPAVDVRGYGAVADGQVATDCYMTSGSAVLTCESNHFVVGDVGKKIAVYGSGPTASGFIQPCSGSITVFTSATQVTTSCTAGNSTTHAIATITTCSRANNIATCDTSANHNFQSGQMVNLQQVGSSGFTADNTFTGVWPIQTVPTGSSFTINSVLLPDVVSVSGGTADGHSERVVWGTDNTAALQAAVDACGTLGGCKVILPKGLYLLHGISMPCSLLGNFIAQGGLNCTIAYNNITFAGDGIGTTTLENWDASTNPNTYQTNGWLGLISLGASVLGDYDVPEGNWPAYSQRNIEIYGITFKQIKYASSRLKTISDVGASDSVKVHHSKFSGPYECLYEGGKSTNWDVHDNYFAQCGLGGPAFVTALSAINANGNYSHIHDNSVTDSGQALEGAGYNSEVSTNKLDGGGTDVTSGVSPHVWLNLTSGSYGIGSWTISYNTVHGWNGGSIENVNGTLQNISVEHNEFIDVLSGITIGSGKEINNVNYGPQAAQIHGLSSVGGNTWIYTGAHAPNTFAFSVNGNQKPYLENVVFDRNMITYKTGFCSLSPHKSCLQSADCLAGSCAIPTGLVAVTAPGLGPKWLPSTVYASGTVAVPALDNTYIYMNKGSAGTSGGTEPIWCTTTNCTVADNMVTWTLYGSRPRATISNLSVVAPPSIGPYGTEIRIDPGTPRSAVSITNLRYNNATRIISGSSTTTGQNDVGFTVETVPASQNYTENNHFSDSLPNSQFWNLGQNIIKVTTAPGTSYGWTVTRAGYYGPAWTTRTTCNFGDFITASPDDAHVFRAINAAPGVTGSSQPLWNLGGSATTTDETCTWQESGTSAVFSPLAPKVH
jgi:hypothetical protein